MSEKTSANGAHGKVTNGLAWFSIGLGLAEVVAPGGMADLIGVRNNKRTRNMLRTYGLREMAAGIGILSQPRAAGWLWGRVAGDLVDLASLGSALKSTRSNRTRVAVATAAVAGVTALDLYCSKQLSAQAQSTTNGQPEPLKRTMLINRSPEEIYGFCRELSNLPQFVKMLESVQMTGDNRAHFRAKRLKGSTIEWDVEIVEDHPGRLLAWRFAPGSKMQVSGRISFDRAPGGRGTLVKQELRFTPANGPLVHKIAKIFAKTPVQAMMGENLRRLKQILETGEVMKSDASIHTGMHAAQPDGELEFAGQGVRS